MPSLTKHIALILLVVITTFSMACAPNAGKDGADGAGAIGAAGIPGADGADGSGSGSAPQSPSSLTTEAQSPSRIDVRWVFNTGTEMGFNIQRSETEGEWETIAGTAANVTVFHDDSVECEHTYSYRVLAYNDYGESAPSSEADATADFCQLDAPGDLTAILDEEQDDGAQRAVLLSWSEGAGQLPGVPASYEVYRKTFDGAWSDSPLATQPADQTTYTDEDAACGGTFQYRVRAANENDVKSAFSNVSTSHADACPLVDPSNLTATTDHAGSIDLNWDINDPDATGYLLQRRVNEARADWITIVDLPEGSTSHNDAGAECETAEYDYRLRAYNGDKQSAWIETLTPGSSYCVVDAPTGLLAEAADDTSMQLTWTDNSDNESGFHIYRDTLLIHTTAADVQTYLDEGRVCETDYEYYVEALNDNVISDPSNTDRSTTSWCPVDAPTGLTASTTQVGHILLDWSDNSNEEMGYYVQRSEIGLETWITITSLPSDSTSHQDEAATCETLDYDYRVQAYDRNTVSDWSNTATGSSYCPVDAPTGLYASTLGHDEIELTWVNTADNATGIRIYRGDTELTTLAPDATSYNDTTVDCQTLYRYKLTAYTANVESDFTNSEAAQTDWCPIATPDNLATLGNGNEVTVSWGHDQQYVESFDVQRRVESEGTWQLLDTVTAPDTNVTDTTVECYKTYDYRVLAYNENVASNWSDLAAGAATGCTPTRPQPVLSSSTPLSYVAFSNEDEAEPKYPLTVNGDGIASDTKLEVGDFLLDCNTGGEGSSCLADGSGDIVPGSCATTCTASLPNDVMRNSGTYVVRLVTPDPVYSGLNTSADTKSINVITTLPEISKIWPRGVLQRLDPMSQPIAQVIDIKIWAQKVMDNSYVSLAGNMGLITDIQEDPDTGEQVLSAVVSTTDLTPRDEPYGFSIVNPSPGGGEHSEPFGINTQVETWNDFHVTDLRPTRMSGRRPWSASRVKGQPGQMSRGTGLAWNGDAEFVSLRDSQERLLARVPRQSALGVLPTRMGNLIDFEASHNTGALVSLSNPGTLYRGSDMTYGSRSAIDTGGNIPISLVLADFNSDGALDMIACYETYIVGKIEFRPGNGDGTFGAETTVDMGDDPLKAVAADFNGDGALDLATANKSSYDVSVCLGDGAGNFGAVSNYEMGNEPASIAAADLNGDGVVDLVTANSATENVSIRLGNGDGSFGDRNDHVMGDSPRSVAVADLNGDGFADLVTANTNGDDISVRLGYGDGNFGERTDYDMGDGPSSVVVTDLNGDGALDLATSNINPDNLSLRMGNGDGTFGARTDLAMGNAPRSITAADLNGDGAPDLVTANSESDDISIRLGNGDGTFGARTDLAMGDQAYWITAADINGDGAPDLLTADRVYSLSIRLANGADAFGTNVNSVAMSREALAVTAADLNGDGVNDLITANRNDAVFGHGYVSINLGNGDGSYGARSDIDMGENSRTYSVAAAYFNGDDNIDLAAVNTWTDTVSIFLGNGNGTFGASTDYATGDYPRCVKAADFNSDEILDLVTANQVSGSISIFMGNGDGTFGAKTDYDMGAGAQSIVVVDINANGPIDVATANWNQGTIAIRLGNGDGTFTSKTDVPANLAITDIAAADFNGDDRPDLVSVNQGSGDVSVRLNIGGRTYGASVDYEMGINLYSATVDDLNGDGIPDLVTADAETDSISIRLCNGDGTFGEKTDFPVGDRPKDVIIANLDGDNTPDIATANFDSDDVSVCLMGIIPGDWRQELTDSLSDDPNQPWLPRYAQVGFTDLDIHQGAQTVTKVGVRVLLEWTTQPAGSVDLGLTAPDGQMVDLGSHSDFTPWPNAENPTSWRLNKTFRGYDFNGETGIAGLVGLHGLQPTDYWTLSIDNQTGASAEVKNFTVLTDGHF
jgi:fibronectin type 3 domain-containing protein